MARRNRPSISRGRAQAQARTRSKTSSRRTKRTSRKKTSSIRRVSTTSKIRNRFGSSARGKAFASKKRATTRNQRLQVQFKTKQAAQRKAKTRSIVSSRTTNRRTSTIGKSRGTSRTIGGVGIKTIKAQQKLSNRFGVTTFNRRGGLSTLPTLQSGGFSDINVGIGSFSDLNKFAEAAIQKQVAIETNIRQRTGAGVTIDDFGRLQTASADSPIFVSDPREPQRRFNQETGNFDSGSGLESLVDNAPIAIAALIGIIIFMRLIKRR